jgi:hypothetical protein
MVNSRIFVSFDKEFLDGQNTHHENDRVDLHIELEDKSSHDRGLLWKEKGTSIEGNNQKKSKRKKQNMIYAKESGI